MSLELAEAQTVLAAARDHAASLGLDVAIAILDARADDVLVARMDGARYTAFEIARGKALNHGRMIYGRGAVPLVRADGTRAGAIGVSGALPEQDEEIASAGAAALGPRQGERR